MDKKDYIKEEIEKYEIAFTVLKRDLEKYKILEDIRRTEDTKELLKACIDKIAYYNTMLLEEE